MSEELAAGDTFGDFLIDTLIGRGGMGLVYRAIQLGLGRQVALKLIAPHLAEDPVFQDRFRREARQAASIDHPAIIPIYAAGEAEGRLYLAMRYVDGTDLSSLLSAEGHLTSARSVEVLEQVAGALDAAHAGGLVHRDVKPANILIESLASGRRRAYLTDFGLVRQADDTQLTRSGAWLGTVDYMAPEQFQSASRIDGRADQYALACVAYETLAGTPPFPRDSDPQAMFAHLNEPPPQLTEARPELPAEVDAVLARGLAKSADDRFGTCTELVTALASALGESRSTETATDGPAGPLLPSPSAGAQAAGVAPATAAGAVASTAAGARRTPRQRGRAGRLVQDRAAVLGALAVAIVAAAIVIVLVSGGSKTSSTTTGSVSGTGTTTTGTGPVTSTTALIANGFPTTAKGVLAQSGVTIGGTATYAVNGGHLGRETLKLTFNATALRVRFSGKHLAYDYVLDQPSGHPRWICVEYTGKPTRCYPAQTSAPYQKGQAPDQLMEDVLVVDGDVVSHIATKQLNATFTPLTKGPNAAPVYLSHQAGEHAACISGTVRGYTRTMCIDRPGIVTYAHVAGQGQDWLEVRATRTATVIPLNAFTPPAKLK